MATNDYHFEEQWIIPGHSPDRVYAALHDATILPQWWRGVYREVVPFERYSRPVVGAKARVRAGGFLPYTLSFVLEALRLERGRLIEIGTTGDFDGVWRATLAPHGDGTRVELDWRVRVDKPLIRLLSWLLKPLFAWNHRWTTQRGERGLLEYLDRKHAVYRFAPAPCFASSSQLCLASSSMIA